MLAGSPKREIGILLGLRGCSIEARACWGLYLRGGSASQLTYKYLVAKVLIRNGLSSIAGKVYIDVLTVDSHRSHSGDTPREETRH